MSSSPPLVCLSDLKGVHPGMWWVVFFCFSLFPDDCNMDVVFNEVLLKLLLLFCIPSMFNCNIFGVVIILPLSALRCADRSGIIACVCCC